MSRHRTFEHVLDDALQDPAFRHLWDVNAVKREITSSVLKERLKRKLTQAELAQIAGRKQPSIARVERGQMPSIVTLNKIAKALGARLEIRFV